MEYAVPACQRSSDVLAELRDVGRRRTASASPFPVEVRVAAADDIWLSTAHGRETAYIAVHQYYRQPTTARYFDAVEAIVGDHGGRPHWGKMHTRDADVPRAASTRGSTTSWPCATASTPSARFGNPYLERVLGP